LRFEPRLLHTHARAIELSLLPKALAVRRSEADAGHGIVREARVVDSFLPCSTATIHESIGEIGFSSLIHAPLESPTDGPLRSRVSPARAFTTQFAKTVKPGALGRRAHA
jgi:hypothetical protein